MGDGVSNAGQVFRADPNSVLLPDKDDRVSGMDIPDFCYIEYGLVHAHPACNGAESAVDDSVPPVR